MSERGGEGRASRRSTTRRGPCAGGGAQGTVRRGRAQEAVRRGPCAGGRAQQRAVSKIESIQARGKGGEEGNGRERKGKEKGKGEERRREVG